MERVRIFARAPAQFIINRTSEAGISLKNIRYKENGIAFTISAAEMAETDKTFKRAGIKYSILKHKGIGATFKGIIKRYGLIAGAAVFITSVALYSLCVFGTEIKGNENVKDETILNAIYSGGVKFPIILKEPNIDAIKTELLKIDGISGAEVTRNGAKLFINILESQPGTDIEDTRIADIVATEDGVITSVVTVSGTPLVKAGDAVRKGDVLIAGYIVDAEENKVPVRAAGEVYAKIWRESRTVYADTVIRKTRTGKSKTYTVMEIFGLKYEPVSPFNYYEKDITEKLYTNIFPFKTRSITFYEITDVETEFDFESEKDNLISIKKAELEQTLPEKAEILDSWFLIKRLDKMTELSIYYELRTNIAAVQLI